MRTFTPAHRQTLQALGGGARWGQRRCPGCRCCGFSIVVIDVVNDDIIVSVMSDLVQESLSDDFVVARVSPSGYANVEAKV